MSTDTGKIRGLVERFFGRLRFPYLFLLTAAVFLADLAFPDAIPFADEILLGLATLLLSRIQRKELPAPGDPSRR